MAVKLNFNRFNSFYPAVIGSPSYLASPLFKFSICHLPFFVRSRLPVSLSLTLSPPCQSVPDHAVDSGQELGPAELSASG
jgi:hypothetical protein